MTTTEHREYSVVIVGAGASGLQCANDLIAGGLDHTSVLIVEAQRYKGGRIKETIDFVQGESIDLGAEFIHGSSTILHDTAIQHGMPLVDLFCWAHGDGGPLHDAVDGGYGLYYYADTDRILHYNDSDSDFIKTNKTLSGIMFLDEKSWSPQMSMQDFYRCHGYTASMIDMANAGYANTLCSNGNELSIKQMIRWNRVWGEDEENLRFKTGFTSIVKHLQRGLQIKLDSPVREIRYGSSVPATKCISSKNREVEKYLPPVPEPSRAAPVRNVPAPAAPAVVPRCTSAGTCQGSPSSSMASSVPEESNMCVISTTSGETILAQRVVVTASAHVMKSNIIEFSPPLPSAVTSAFESIDMHIACKVLLKFSERPWPAKLQGMICAGTAVPEYWFREIDIPADSAASSNSSSSNASKGRKVYTAAGFATAGFAQELLGVGRDGAGGKSEAEVVQTTLDQLQHMLGRLAPAHMTASADSAAGTAVNTNARNEKEGDGYISTEPITATSSNAAATNASASAAVEDIAVALPLASAVFEGGMVHVWSPHTHPYIGGGYSPARAGFDVDYAKLISTPITAAGELSVAAAYGSGFDGGGEGVEGEGKGKGEVGDERLFLAGEAVAEGAGATVCAAMKSGRDTAAKVLRSLGILSHTKSST